MKGSCCSESPNTGLDHSADCLAQQLHKAFREFGNGLTKLLEFFFKVNLKWEGSERPKKSKHSTAF